MMSDRTSVSQLIARVGETDQLFLTQPTPTLAIERAYLRLELVKLSNSKNEQLHFLSEAAVILELAGAEIEDQETSVLLSAQLAAVYLQFHLVTHEARYLVVAGQILRPHSNAEYHSIFLQLARLDAALNKTALTKHWLTRWLQVLKRMDSKPVFEGLEQYPEFAEIRHELWFEQISRDADASVAQSIPNPITAVHS